MIRILLAFILTLFISASALAQHSFQMNYSAAAVPNAGWPGDGAYADRSTFTIAHVPGGGPSGQDAYRMQLDYDNNASSFGGQFNWGWRGVLSSPSQPTWGSSQFYRWRMKFETGTNYLCRDWEDGSQGVNCINKILIVNDGCGNDPCRPIITIESDKDAQQFQVVVQTDGGDNQTKSPYFPTNQWIDIQIEIKWNSSQNAGNAYYKLWVNNDDYNNPTAATTGIQLNISDNPGYTKFGGYMNHGVASNGIYRWLHADFQTSPTFDSSWHSGVVQTCTTYYVDSTGGNDANSGCTESTPLRTIAAVLSAGLEPGNTILLRRDRTFREQITLPVGGTEDAPITISAYGTGSKPIISGANVVSGFSAAGTNLWAAVLDTEPALVACDGTVGTQDATPDSACEWTWSGGTLTIYAASDPDSLYDTVEAAVRDYGIELDSVSHVILANLQIQYAAQYGIRLEHAQNVTISSVDSVWNAVHGLAVEGGSPYSDDLLVAGCTLSNNGQRGMDVLVGMTNGPQRTILRDSVISGNGWRTTGTNWAQGVEGNFAGGAIYRNIIANNAGPNTSSAGNEHGLYLIGYVGQTEPVEIWGNVFSGQSRGSGIKLSNASALIHHNLFDGNGYDGVTFGETNRQGFTATLYYNVAVGNGQACFREALDATNPKTITIINNTCIGSIQAANDIAGGLTLRNNIVYRDGAVTLSMVEQSAMTSDYNLLYRAGGSPSLTFYANAARTWAAWQALGFDVHGINADPDFVDLNGGNFKLDDDSPAIDAAADSPDNEDYEGEPVPQGSAPDIGAYERAGVAPPPTMPRRLPFRITR